MKTRYFRRKQNSDVVEWIEMSGAEYLDFVRDPENKDRFFLNMKNVVLERSKEEYLQSRTEKRRSDYLAESKKGWTIISLFAQADKESTGEEVIPDPDADVEENILHTLAVQRVREVVDALPEEDAALLALIENLQRRDLDYLEEAAAISRLIGRYGLSQQQAAEKLGKSQPAIANKLRLLRLGPPVTDCLRQYGLTERHARALLRLTDPEQQLAAARHMGQRGLNVAQAEQYIDALAAQNRTEPLRRRPTYIIKDVRLFLNSVERGVRLMQSAGVGAEVGRRDTDEEILLTIHIPKRRPAGVVTDS